MLTFLNALPGAVSQGLIWGVMAIGVYLTYKILDIADLTVDGSFCTGGAVFVMLFTAGVNVWPAMLAATLAGMLAGLVTGLLHTQCGIPAILAGILTQLGLYSVNMSIMDFKASVALNVCILHPKHNPHCNPGQCRMPQRIRKKRHFPVNNHRPHQPEQRRNH